jgi:hypothetical protein
MRLSKAARYVANFTPALHLRISGFKLEACRIPDADGNRLLLGAIERARKVIPLFAALRALHLSARP